MHPIFRSFRENKIVFLFGLFWAVGILSTTAQTTANKNLVILHLNDTHSRIEPLQENDPHNANRGGVIRQNAYIEQVRSKNKNVLLFHCGDFVHGTPYFNIFRGEAEVDIMNFMKFDAVCLGNHEFDYGLENLAEIIRKSKYPYITTNLDFTGTPVEGLTKPFLVIDKAGIRIGIIGLTINPEGILAQKNYEKTKWLDPIVAANETADYLRKKEKCDLVICLSHLGIYFSEEELGDLSLVEQSHDIDIILGGHTHTFLRFPERRQNADGEEVLINQVGVNGIYVGRLDVTMEKL